MKELGELVLLPIAARGHLLSALEFAKLVVGRDDRLSVTVLITDFPPDAKLAAYADYVMASFGPSQHIKFARVANHCASVGDATSHPAVSCFSQLVESHKLPVRNHVANMVRDSGTRLVGFVVDMYMIPMADVADEFGIPTYVFWTASAGYLSLQLHLVQIQDRTGIPVEEFGDSESLNVPGFNKPVPNHALPAFWSDDLMKADLFHTARSLVRRTKGVIMNTCKEIEPRAISSFTLMPVYPVGPLLNLTTDCSREAFSGCASLQDGTSIVDWLDDQPPSSVIFLCFGSVGSFSPDQVKEIALALERTGFRFLWTLRLSQPKGTWAWISNACEDPANILPEGFLQRTANVGRIIGWAPQAAVLEHRAVGGFVSHCGWNSLLESLWFGVPVAAWPLYAEQQTNAFEMVTELGLALAVKPGCRTDRIVSGVRGDEAPLVSAEQIEAAMRSVMEGESAVRKRVKEASEKCRKAVTEGGSSLSALDSFVSDVFKSLCN